MNTIFALSTVPGKSGVAIYRVSGPDAKKSLELMCNLTDPAPREVILRKVYHYTSKELIDNAIVIYFPAPHSFTGEDVVEFHIHGSIAIIKLMAESLANISNYKLAERGEFAKRAFLNGKMDLTAIEGLADLIESETIIQHKQAMRQMCGELEKLYETWRKVLLKILSLLEAYIDFPDEDIPTSILEEIKEKIAALKESFKSHLNDNRKGERLRQGIYTTIIGPANVGKSTLLNFLALRDIAIVSDIPGTTRDFIETHLDIGGYPIILTDTAGIRETENIIEQEGIKRAYQLAKSADIKIIMLDSDISSEMLEFFDDNSIIIINKIDQNPNKHFKLEQKDVLYISLKENINTDLILEKIKEKAENLASLGESPSITRIRHRKSIEETLMNLEHFSLNNDIVLACEDLRLAARALSRLIGKIDVESILGEIFSSFCIGK